MKEEEDMREEGVDCGREGRRGRRRWWEMGRMGIDKKRREEGKR